MASARAEGAGSRANAERRGRRLRAGAASVLGVSLLLSLAISSRPVRAAEDGAEDTDDSGPAVALTRAVPADGPAFPVDRFDVTYLEPSPDLPALSDVLPVSVRLSLSDSGYVAPRPGEAQVSLSIGGPDPLPAHYHSSAIGTISRALLAAMHEQGLLGLYVEPSTRDIDVDSERDLRAPDNRTLRISIWVGRIRDVRTVAVGDRVSDDWTIDNPVHRKIRSYSPLRPPIAGQEETTDLLDRRALEDYIYRLNRHPGRHVEAGLAASEDGEGIDLDYRIYESRAWNAYAQASNTGTERTNLWQSRFGYVNREVTDRDDVLSIEYMNSGFNDVNAITASFDAPWFAPKRAAWLESTGKEPPWLAWADRSKVPWWGLGRLRWRLQGGWSRFEAGAAGLTKDGFPASDTVLSKEWNIGGRFSYNFFQHRNLFIDAFIGGRFRGIKSTNEIFSPNEAKVTLFLADLGLVLERVNQYSSINAILRAERAGPLGDVNDYQVDFETALGRSTSDPRWWALHWDVGVSQYLEPLIDPSGWRNPSTPSSSTLSHELALGLRGQYAFDYRLIPQASQVIGGLYSVRGFPQGLAVGDSVFIGSFEYRFHIPRALPIRPRPTQLPWIGDFRVVPQQVYGRPDWDLVLRAFVDAGLGVRNNRSVSTLTEINQGLVGAGVGLELNFLGRVRARVDWARGVYQNIDCNDSEALCRTVKADPGLDPAGEFHFLFSVMY